MLPRLFQKQERRRNTKMKRKMICCLLVMLSLLCTSGLAESVWVEEDWQHVNEQLDCDGLPLVIDADVLQVPENNMVREYRTYALNHDFMVAKGNEIDWSALGCDTSLDGTWRYPTKAWPEYAYHAKESYPSFIINSLCSMHVRSCYPEYAKHDSGNFSDEFDLSPLGSLTEEKIREDAETVANTCGLQLGNPIKMYRVEDTEQIRTWIEESHFDGIYQPQAENAEDWRYIEIYYPVYFQGLRLYSGTYKITVDDLEVPTWWMRMTVTAEKGLLSVQTPIFDPSRFEATGEEQKALNVDEAIAAVQKNYAEMYLPGLKQVTITKMALEYVAVTGDVSASSGYTFYPAWVVNYTWEYESGETFSSNQGYHAVTGKRIF